MPIFAVKARWDEFEGVARLVPSPGATYCLDLQQGSEVRKDVFLDPEQQEDAPGGKGICNLLIGFPGGNQARVSFVDVEGISNELIAEDSGDEPVAFACFDCRGCDIVGYTPGGACPGA